MHTKHNGLFITFEGGEGCGKSTQIKKLYQHMLNHFQEECAPPITLTREPGGSSACDHIRRILLEHEWSPMTEALLFAANRFEHCETVIKPALQDGHIVLCDRFMDSTTVYQGIAMNLGCDVMQQLHSLCAPVTPHITFVLMMPPEKALKRLQHRLGNNYMDARDANFHEKVYAGFEKLIKTDPKRFVMVPADDTEDVVFARIITELKEHAQGRMPWIQYL